MKKAILFIAALLLTIVGIAYAQEQFWVRLVTTSLPNEPGIGTHIVATVTLDQGYAGMNGTFGGTLVGYLFTSYPNIKPAHYEGAFDANEWQTRRYVIQLDTPYCILTVCYSQVAVDSAQVAVQPVRITFSAHRDTSLCDIRPDLYQTFGPECLNPVPYNLPGLETIGTHITFNGNLTGVITGYYWSPVARSYFYVVEQDNTSNPRIGWIVAPVNIQIVGHLRIGFWWGVRQLL